MPKVKADAVEIAVPQGAARFVTALAAAALVLIGIGVPAAPARAATKEDWARCIWERVPATAWNWVQLPRLRRGAWFGEASVGYRLQVRLMAACYESLPPARDGGFRPDARALQAAANAARPAEAGADRIEPFATRCEVYFEDDPAFARPAGVDWGFGEDRAGRQFGRTRTLFGDPFSQADMAALAGNSDRAMLRAVRRLTQVQPARVRTLAAGEAAAGAPFVLDDDAGLRRCRVVQADGSLADA